MSKLPEVSTEKIYQRLSSNLSSKQTETLYQLAHLELLAEALRDQRDGLQQEVEKLRVEVEELRTRSQPQAYPPSDAVEGEVTDVTP